MKHTFQAGAFIVALAVTTPQILLAHEGVDEASTLISSWHSLAHLADVLLLPGLIVIGIGFGIANNIHRKRQERRP